MEKDSLDRNNSNKTQKGRFLPVAASSFLDSVKQITQAPVSCIRYQAVGSHLIVQAFNENRDELAIALRYKNAYRFLKEKPAGTDNKADGKPFNTLF